MAANTEQLETEVPDVEEEIEEELTPETEEEEGEEGSEESTEGLSVQFGDEEAAEPEQDKAPQWVTELRKSHRELIKENRELKKVVQTVQPTQQKPALPERPKLADHDYDEDKHQAALDGWYAKKMEIDKFEENQRRAVEQQQRQADDARKAYQEKASTLKVADYKAAEEEVIASLSEAQQGLILGGADNPPLLVYALGKNPKRLAELAAIKDPVKFAFAAAKLEKDLKTSPRKTDKPVPETVVRSSGPVTSSSAALERLRTEADKTGDFSKVLAYKKAQKAKSRA